MIKPRIPLANEAPYLRNDHHEKVKNSPKPRPQWKVAQWLCKICSMCEKWWVVWKCDLYWIFVWNMLNVWKYGHLCEKLNFIGYLCQCLKIWSFVWKFYFRWTFLWNMLNVCKYGCFWSVQFSEVLCSISGEVSDFWRSKRETRLQNARLAS
jgi:hypothetical protein